MRFLQLYNYEIAIFLAMVGGDAASLTLSARRIVGKLIALKPAERYPENPNGSEGGLTGLTTPDGRATILMPHPERAFRSVQHSWHPRGWDEDGPWIRLFQNARAFVA